jgi:hypothetical protein
MAKVRYYEGGEVHYKPRELRNKWMAIAYPSKVRMFKSREEAEAWLAQRVAEFGARAPRPPADYSRCQPFLGEAFFG